MALTRIKSTNITNGSIVAEDLHSAIEISTTGNGAFSSLSTTGDLSVGGNTAITGNLTVDGSVSFSSSNTAGTFTFGEGDKLQFGDSQEFEIYYDGTNAVLESNSLTQIKSSYFNVYNDSPNARSAILAQPGAGTKIWYDDTIRFETTNTGIDVTGTITADNLTLYGDLLVQGNTTSINTNDLSIEDLNITLAAGSANSAVANGAGITIDGANVQLTYRTAGDEVHLNKSFIVDGGSGVASAGTLHVRQRGDGGGDGIAITSTNATSHRIWKDSSGTLNIGPSSILTAFKQDLQGYVTINSGGNTSSVSKMTIESQGKSQLWLKSDTGNAAAEPGGAAIKLMVDGSANNGGTISYINTAGTDGADGTITNSVGNALFLGNSLDQPILFGLNSTVIAGFASDGDFGLGRTFNWSSGSTTCDEIFHIKDSAPYIKIENTTEDEFGILLTDFDAETDQNMRFTYHAQTNVGYISVRDATEQNEWTLYPSGNLNINAARPQIELESTDGAVIVGKDIATGAATGSAHAGYVHVEGENDFFVRQNDVNTVKVKPNASVYNYNDQPSVRPSLNLDFANAKKLDPRVTFARTSTATYYDGRTKVKAEQNLHTYSTDFTGATWGNTNVVQFTGGFTAPDGTSTAQKMTAVSASLITPQVTFGNTFAIRQGGTYVQSVYAKAAGFNWLFINGIESGDFSYFDLANGVAGSISNQNVSAGIEDVGNGWYRCHVVITRTTNIGHGTGYGMANTNSQYYWTVPNTTDGILLWGPQIEEATSVGPYIPTTDRQIVTTLPTMQTALANKPRFDHEPLTGESLGLKVEASKTNINPYSVIDTVGWAGNNCNITANAAIAPDGTKTAAYLHDTATASSSFHGAYRGGITVTSGVTYTISGYFKKGFEDNVGFRLYDGAGMVCRATFNLDTGTPNLINGTNADMEHVGNGWYRCWITGVANQNYSSSDIYVFTTSVYTHPSNGDNSIYAWGIQMEAGGFPSSYIPTYGAQATRTGDTPYLTVADHPWFVQGQGTLYTHSRSDRYDFWSSPVTMQDTTTPNYNIIAHNWHSTNAEISGEIINNGSQNYNDLETSNPRSEFSRIATAYERNNVLTSVNGSTGTLDTGANIPIVDTFYIGRFYTGSIMTGHIKKIAYYPERLSNEEIVALTEE